MQPDKQPREIYCAPGDNGEYHEVHYHGDAVEPTERRPAAKKFPNKIYRVEDALRIEQLFDEHQVVIIEADMGSGKSSILRSLASLYEYENGEVLHLSGHRFPETDAPQELERNLQNVTQKTKLLIIDSTDYLYQQKRFARTGKTGYEQRMQAMINQIQAFIAAHPDIKVVLTVHNDNWNKIRADQDLKALFDTEIREKPETCIYHPSRKVNRTTLVRYLHHEEGLTREEAWFFVDAVHSLEAQNLLNERGYLKKYGGDKFNYFDVLSEPKIIGHVFKKHPSLKLKLKAAFHGDLDRKMFLEKFMEAALTIHYQSIFLPIITQERGKRREQIWGTFDTLDGTEGVADGNGDEE